MKNSIIDPIRRAGVKIVKCYRLGVRKVDTGMGQMPISAVPMFAVGSGSGGGPADMENLKKMIKLYPQSVSRAQLEQLIKGLSSDELTEVAVDLNPQKRDEMIDLLLQTKKDTNAVRKIFARAQNQLGADTAAGMFLRLSPHDQQRILEKINEKTLAKIIQVMEEPDRAGILGQLPAQKSELVKTYLEKRLGPLGEASKAYCRDLVQEALDGKLDPIIGRDQEIDRLIEVLCKRKKNNAVLIGKPGVGKTAVVEGLAERLAEGDVPEDLKGKKILSLDINAMIAGSIDRGEFEGRIKKLLEEVKNSNRMIILFIDELHQVVGAGRGAGSTNMADILKPPLARGELSCIGATTLEEYKKYIEKDGALERRFEPILVEEPTVSETISILRGLKSCYEEDYGVTISEESLVAAATIAHKYIHDRFLPDKAIDLLDTAASRCKLRNSKTYWNKRVGEKEEEIGQINRNLEKAEQNKVYKTVAALAGQLEKTRRALLDLKRKVYGSNTVLEEDIAGIASIKTGIPIEQIRSEESERLLKMEEFLKKKIVGQDAAIEAISNAIRRAYTGIKDPKLPIGAFIFAGPTGVGKTELAKALAEFLFHDEEALKEIDMSEYADAFNRSRLIGAPPGYVGHDEAGQLTEFVRKKPFSVILFDEIEKAHPDVFDTLLQVMGEGARLTDGQGRTVSFKNTIIIMTSNIGVRPAEEKETGFYANGSEKNAAQNHEETKKNILREIKTRFKPEFRNRLTEIIVFNRLEKRHFREIAQILCGDFEKKIFAAGYKLTVDDKVVDLIAQKGDDPKSGAREMKRAITAHIENPLAVVILEKKFKEGDAIRADLEGDKVVFKPAKDTKESAPREIADFVENTALLSEKINPGRLAQSFINVVKIWGPSGEEKDVAAFLLNELKALGLENIQQDQTGNVIACLPANKANAPRLLLSAHMDTRSLPEGGAKVVVSRNGTISTDGTTILGADDRAGVAAILEVIATIKQQGLPHGEICIVFT